MSIPVPTFALLVALAVAPAEPLAAQERIESIALQGSGTAGTVVTTPVLLGGARTTYEFGRGACRSHKLANEVVKEMIAAMRARAPVRIEVAGDGRCITAVTFFAPEA